jgi:hypothetical protein
MGSTILKLFLGFNVKVRNTKRSAALDITKVYLNFVNSCETCAFSRFLIVGSTILRLFLGFNVKVQIFN